MNPAYPPGAFFKGQPDSGCAATREEARSEKSAAKALVVAKESRNKSAARKRDGWVCRFPRCSCHLKRLHPEVGHCDGDKGMGSDHGNRSRRNQLICLCIPRHQTSWISLHKKNLRIVFLTPEKADGPVAWLVNVTAIDRPLAPMADAKWIEVARELSPCILSPLTHEQGALLERIAEMTA
jgi:hypothetical protein